jgi:hypothetical protein
MIDKIVNLLFRWGRLRDAIFNEVDWENSIARTLSDPESMKISSAMWCEPDGWRGWHVRKDGSYYFHDTPEKDFGDIFDIVLELKN